MPHPDKFALESSSWPFVEARSILDSLKERSSSKGYVLFQTGYGPSGLPHIGTFAEVARTSMVRHAFSVISNIPSHLFAFSDDMDGLRKVPENIPNQEMLSKYIGYPLTSIPDPFGTHESFGHHNNARLRAFLDEFDFEYKFTSSTECYKSGKFDSSLLKVLKNYDEITNLILPTLGKERRSTYSPFLPICKQTNRVLQVPIISRNTEAKTIVYQKDNGGKVETLVTGGNCKLQWKVDWAMRWANLDVNYEMSGKDLIESVKLSSKICRILGGIPPQGFTYELFLDQNGEKISKSRGNGLSVEEWLSYAPKESLAMYMFQKPKSAKRLYFDVIPRNVDDYLTHLENVNQTSNSDIVDNPAWHIHRGKPPKLNQKLNYSLLLNLASVCNSENKEVLWYFISRYQPDLNAENAPFLDKLVGHAINYYRDFIKPFKNYRTPSNIEREALRDLLSVLKLIEHEANAAIIQAEIYKIGKHYFPNELRIWFKGLYEVLLGQSTGPRMGSFIAIYGVRETIELINAAVSHKN